MAWTQTYYPSQCYTSYLCIIPLGKGFVKAQNFRNSSNKRGYVYLLTPDGVAAKANLTRHFLARKREEYDALRLEIERLQRESEGSAENTVVGKKVA